jgi:hypothetical protein
MLQIFPRDSAAFSILFEDEALMRVVLITGCVQNYPLVDFGGYASYAGGAY